MPVLTDRELAVLGLMGHGCTATQAAVLLGLSPHTVTGYKRSIFAKLGVRSQSHAVSRAIALGLFDGANRGLAPTRTGHGHLTVVHGPAGSCLSDVTGTLRLHGQAFVLAPTPELGAGLRWSPPTDGRLVTVLVDPDHTAWQLPQRLHAPAVVVHSATPDLATTVTAVLRGAHAILGHADVHGDLCPVLALALYGYHTLSPASVRLMASVVPTLMSPQAPLNPHLTGREREILLSAALGHTVLQTARSLGIAVKTVENIQTRLFRKLGTRNRSEALLAAHRGGLL
ncbi:MAG TPA: LuxR C-terminal-related transcriptional regulator [Rugosimonospora sp.]|nr:LuxR C-terminal-related transcriptional regulator [Rugosimonospora sp.]